MQGARVVAGLALLVLVEQAHPALAAAATPARPGARHSDRGPRGFS